MSNEGKGDIHVLVYYGQDGEGYEEYEVLHPPSCDSRTIYPLTKYGTEDTKNRYITYDCGVQVSFDNDGWNCLEAGADYRHHPDALEPELYEIQYWWRKVGYYEPEFAVGVEVLGPITSEGDHVC